MGKYIAIKTTWNLLENGKKIESTDVEETAHEWLIEAKLEMPENEYRLEMVEEEELKEEDRFYRCHPFYD